jgi:hypothetical protein
MAAEAYICYTLHASQDCWAILALLHKISQQQRNKNYCSAIRISLFLSSKERKYTL